MADNPFDTFTEALSTAIVKAKNGLFTSLTLAALGEMSPIRTYAVCPPAGQTVCAALLRASKDFKDNDIGVFDVAWITGTEPVYINVFDLSGRRIPIGDAGSIIYGDDNKPLGYVVYPKRHLAVVMPVGEVDEIDMPEE